MTDQAIPIRKFNDDEALAWLRARLATRILVAHEAAAT